MRTKEGIPRYNEESFECERMNHSITIDWTTTINELDTVENVERNGKKFSTSTDMNIYVWFRFHFISISHIHLPALAIQQNDCECILSKGSSHGNTKIPILAQPFHDNLLHFEYDECWTACCWSDLHMQFEHKINCQSSWTLDCSLSQYVKSQFQNLSLLWYFTNRVHIDTISPYSIQHCKWTHCKLWSGAQIGNIKRIIIREKSYSLCPTICHWHMRLLWPIFSFTMVTPFLIHFITFFLS